MTTKPPSRAQLFPSIKALDRKAVAAALRARPELARATDDRRRNPLHFLCSLPAARAGLVPLDLARVPLAAGIDIDAPAFVEGAFQATPLWYAISRGRNRWPASCSRAARPPSTASGRPASTTTWRRSTCWSGTGPASIRSRKTSEMLLRHGADPTLRSADGKSPVDLVRDAGSRPT